MTNKEAIEKLKSGEPFSELYFEDWEKALEMGIKALENQKSVIEELEKIKHEIGKEFVDLQDGSEEWRSYVNESVLSCYEIVDKHISELKGNKKGVLESIAEEQKTLSDSTKAWSDYIEKHRDIY